RPRYGRRGDRTGRGGCPAHRPTDDGGQPMSNSVVLRTRAMPTVRPWQRTVAACAGALIAVQLICRSIGWFDTFPDTFDTWISPPFDSVYHWALDNPLPRPIFTCFFTPMSDAIKWMIDTFTGYVLALPWYGVAAIAFVVIARTGRWRVGTIPPVAALVARVVRR